MNESQIPATVAELYRLLLDMLRYGTVAQVQAAPPRVRVKAGDLLTDWLPWFNHRAGEVKTAYQPSPGEQCMIFAPGGNLRAGTVFLGLNSDSNPPPECGPNDYIIQVPVGGKILLKVDESVLEITAEQIKSAIGNSSIVATKGNVKVDADRIDWNEG